MNKTTKCLGYVAGALWIYCAAISPKPAWIFAVWCCVERIIIFLPSTKHKRSLLTRFIRDRVSWWIFIALAIHIVVYTVHTQQWIVRNEYHYVSHTKPALAFLSIWLFHTTYNKKWLYGLQALLWGMCIHHYSFYTAGIAAMVSFVIFLLVQLQKNFSFLCAHAQRASYRYIMGLRIALSALITIYTLGIPFSLPLVQHITASAARPLVKNDGSADLTIPPQTKMAQQPILRMPLKLHSAWHRLSTWEWGLKHLQKHWPLGVGIGRIGTLEGAYQHNHIMGNLYEDKKTTYFCCHPHNAALQVWLELGILGALLYSVLWACVVFFIRKDFLPVALNVFIAHQLSYNLWSKWWLATILLALLTCCFRKVKIWHNPFTHDVY